MTRSISPQQFLPTSLRATIIASAYWVLSLSLTNLGGSIASFMGCLAGCYLIDHFANRAPLAKLRTGVILLACLAGLLAGLGLANLFTGSRLPASLLSPIAAYNAGEFARWLMVSLALTAALRTVARRHALGGLLEIIFVASAFVVTLSAHRNGMIHRPYFVGDFALMRGMDPSAILLAMGCGAVLGLAALLMMESNHRRLPWHFGVLGILCFSLLGYVQFFGLPGPSYTDELGLTGAEQQGREGQSENPFRDGENNSDNLEAPVAIVLFRDDYEPLNGSYYFRETAYSQWNGRLLDITSREDMDRDLVDHFTNTRTVAQEGLPTADAYTPVRTSVGLLTPHRTPFGLETPVAYANSPNPNNLRFKRTYDVESLAPAYDFDQLVGREVGSDAWTEEVWREYLELPQDPRYRELASRLVANLRPQYANDPFAKAWAIKSHLDENGIYSLKNSHAYEEDPAASFLFGDLTGYCMHFAFAATYMYRSLGIPARVGIGYSVPASNRAGGSALLVQAIHGHAWPEVYFRDLGWVIIDPAPRQTLVDMTTDPQNNLQQLLGDMLRNEASFDDFLAANEESAIPWGAILDALYLVLLVSVIAGYAARTYRQQIALSGPATELYRLGYRAALDKLAALGIRRRPGESRESFARRVGDLTPSFQEITRQHLRVALGARRDMAPESRSFDWAGANRKVSRELGQRLPLWKRWLGLLNPYSWLRSR